MSNAHAAKAADPLQEHTELTQRLAALIAEDDEQRTLLVFNALMNQVDGFLERPGEEAARHAQAILLTGAGAPAAGRQAAVSVAPSPPSDSIYSDPVFLANARRVIDNRERIVGGVPTSDYPDCVAVGNDSDWCCSGTLVAPNVVVTAGHCNRGGCNSRILIGDDVEDAGAQVIEVRQAVSHPGYRPPRAADDICVLILDEDAAATPRGIADDAYLTAATSVRLAGFGNTDVDGSTGYGRRRVVDVPLASNDPKFGGEPKTEFVAGAPFLDRDSCNGDSGGPAYVEGNDGWYLAGATSRATSSTVRMCGDGGIYTRVKAYEDWIRKIPGGHWS